MTKDKNAKKRMEKKPAQKDPEGNVKQREPRNSHKRPTSRRRSRIAPAAYRAAPVAWG
jgi:hypothetical protein